MPNVSRQNAKRRGAKVSRDPKDTAVAGDHAMESACAPRCATPAGACRWQPVRISKTVSVQGGFSKKPCAAESMDVGDAIFLRLEKNADWLLKLSGGPKTKKGGLARTSVVENLRKACGLDSQRELVSPTVRVDEDDPMRAVDACAYEGVVPEDKRRKPYYQPKRAVEQVVRVNMPARAVDRSCGDTVSVMLVAKGTNSLWVHVDHVPWLVSYLADERSRCGVDVPQDTADDAKVAENSSVPGLAIRWDFSSNDSWEAVWVKRPLKGEIVRSSVSSLTAEK
jgi:hypothetical protein